MSTPIRVLVVDDHQAFCQPFAFMLAREPDLDVIGAVGTVAAARPLLRGADVAVLDLDLPDGSGVALVNALMEEAPSAKSLILTGGTDEQTLARAIEAGASAILYKSTTLDHILATIRRLHAGEELLSLSEVRTVLLRASQHRDRHLQAQAALASLTPREVQVLEALATGLSDKEIAESLHISAETVRTHMGNLLHKLGVDSRLRAVLFAARYGAIRLR